MPVRAAGLGPFAEQIALRPEVDGIPRLIMRVPEIEIVVMHALDHQKARAGILIDFGELRPGRAWWDSSRAGLPCSQTRTDGRNSSDDFCRRSCRAHTACAHTSRRSGRRLAGRSEPRCRTWPRAARPACRDNFSRWIPTSARTVRARWANPVSLPGRSESPIGTLSCACGGGTSGIGVTLVSTANPSIDAVSARAVINGIPYLTMLVSFILDFENAAMCGSATPVATAKRSAGKLKSNEHIWSIYCVNRFKSIASAIAL